MFVLFWLRIWYESILWVIMGRRGVFSKRRVLVVLVLQSDGWGISEIALRWLSVDLTNEKSTLVKVMTWWHQTTKVLPVNYKPLLFTTVGTPYNTAPYITGSNIARLAHGSQNSWSKLWIPIVKSAPVRVIFTWKSVPKKSIHGSSYIYLGTQWKQRHDSPWSYRSDVIVTFLWYGTIGIIWHRDHQSTAKKV